MVYFVRLISTGHVKIGYTANVSARMQQLLRAHGPIDLLAVVAGGVSNELTYHAKFGALRTTGEWFRPGAHLMSYIATLESCEPVGRVVQGSHALAPLPEAAPPAEPDPTPLPSWLTAKGDAAARGLPLRPPSRVSR